MPDMEKIESLKQCLSASCRGFRTCPYNDTEWDAIKTVLELLAEQEPVEPIVVRVNELDSLFRCGGCGAYVLFRKQKYCHACGRKVKWDDA